MPRFDLVGLSVVSAAGRADSADLLGSGAGSSSFRAEVEAVTSATVLDGAG